MYVKDLLLRILFPVSCVLCKTWGKTICHRCLTKLPKVLYQKCPQCGKHSPYGLTHPSCMKKNSLCGCASLFLYFGNTKKIIKKIKYNGEYALIKDLFSGLSVKEIFNSLKYFISDKKNIVIIPVPLHPSRQLQRGFNQADLIANMISKSTGCQVVNSVLHRMRETNAQAKIHAFHLREKNVFNAFSCDKIKEQTQHIILVDDVWSSGATLRACARAIIKTNPDVKVYGWTLAKG